MTAIRTGEARIRCPGSARHLSATPPRRPALALMIATGAIAAGCGSSSSSPSASAGSKYQQAVRYSECMRTHGVANFPDPSRGGGILVHAGGPGGINPASPAFASAQRACAKLGPKGSPGPRGAIPTAAKKQALKFSACMRSHGVPGFPDPVFSGNGAKLQLSGGVNPAAPAFRAAQKACGSPLPGGIVSGATAVGGPG